MSCELGENPVFVIMHLKCDGIVGTKDEDKDSKTAEIWLAFFEYVKGI